MILSARTIGLSWRRNFGPSFKTIHDERNKIYHPYVVAVCKLTGTTT